MSDTEPDLENAYALEGPEASQRLYAAWAETYDADFADAEGYRLPGLVAKRFTEVGGTGPVLDVGAGTGLVGEAFRQLGIEPVDGLDLSPEMLAIAVEKGMYRDCFTGDVLDRTKMPNSVYSGAVSAGTFTLGHVGPEGVETVVRAVKPGGTVVLSINAAHFEAKGFDSALADLGDQIEDLTVVPVRIYTDAAAASHRDDMANLVAFRRR